MYKISHSVILIIIDVKHQKRRHIECLCPAVVIKLKPVEVSSGLGWEEKRSEVQHLGQCLLTGWVPFLWRL
jgi:hypothetical protein